MEKLLTPKEVAEILQVKLITVMTYLRGGTLRGVKIGRLWRVKVADLEAFVSADARNVEERMLPRV